MMNTIFFIAHKNDRPLCNKFLRTHVRAYCIRPDCIRPDCIRPDCIRPVYCIRPDRIRPNHPPLFFENLQTAEQEITARLQTTVFNKNASCIALFINPVSKRDTSSPYRELNFKIKERLLDKGIIPHTIDRELFERNDFYDQWPAITNLLLTKAGRIPSHPQPVSNPNDLIIGLGVYPPVIAGPTRHPLVSPVIAGSTRNPLQPRCITTLFAFTPSGDVLYFDSFPGFDPNLLIASIRKAIGRFIKKNPNLSRLIIHYAPTTNGKDPTAIPSALQNLDLNIPVSIITINPTSMNPQNLPITIKYPRLLAENLSHFSGAQLPPFAKSTLWFL